MVAPLARAIAFAVDPVVNSTLLTIGKTISAAATQSPLVMGFLLGGIMKMICTSPLSSMALTAMLGLDGLAMGIASIACVGGSFTNGIIFKRLHFGDRSNVIAVMLEPLTQANIITANPIPIFVSNFFGGGLAGLVAAALGIINNAPGTASPIPGLLAPFAFNAPVKVIISIVLGIIGGSVAGFVGSIVFKKYDKANVVENIPSGMTMIADNNPGWTINETTASVETDEIKPGESREYQIVLGWQNGDSNVGTKENIASIITENEAGFEEKDKSDNESKADLIVAVGTGEVPYVAIAGSILLIMISITSGIYVIKKKHQ